jgi:hypothetical protein
MTTAPQDVCGAAIRGWHLDTASKSANQSDCRLRRNPQSGKKEKPLSGEVRLFTGGGLIRVGTLSLLLADDQELLDRRIRFEHATQSGDAASA